MTSTLKHRFWAHKYGAEKRNIPFCFTYSEWLNWWEAHLGPEWYKLRGKTFDTFCMARNGDRGPYAAWNVRCITKRENRAEQSTKITREQAIEIFRSKEKAISIARKFNISRGYVAQIKIRARWGEATKDLTP